MSVKNVCFLVYYQFHILVIQSINKDNLEINVYIMTLMAFIIDYLNLAHIIPHSDKSWGTLEMVYLYM